MARPSVEGIINENLERIPKLRRQGLTEEQVGKVIGVSAFSINKYKKINPGLAEALKKGKEMLIEDLEDSLYKKALGKCIQKTTKKYIEKGADGKDKSRIEETVVTLPPDTGALCFALKNLDPTRWKDNKETTFKTLQTAMDNFKSIGESLNEVDNNETK